MVVALLNGGLAAADLPAVESHLEACGACADLVTWAAADQAHRSRSAGREGRPFVGQLAPGSRVDRYQILSAVGRGGMGEVYAAYHPDLDRRIALKVVGESAANAPEQRARLLREARAIARLSHPNVVAVYDAGTVDDRVYIAMEFVEGETVDEWLRSKPRGWREILDVFIAAGRGLAAAHAAGVVHRDFKPQNVMVGRDGSVRVMDFGLARLADEPADARETGSATEARPLPATVTKTGALVGTLAYMAPEQFRGDRVDARADQFSFCVALHEALHGGRPTSAHVAAALPGGDAELPQAAKVPAWLRAVVSRGVADDREQRFASMDDLLATLAKGRGRPRRRALGAGACLAIVLVALGSWRIARGGRINCAVPVDRLAAVWSGHDDARRQRLQGAFSASRAPAAEAAWKRFSKLLDTYVSHWSAMYVQTCEATHIRGEQSSEVLDLRMSCLAENLDEVNALTNVLSTADTAAVSHSVTAVQGLTPVPRCADITVLRSAVPLPRDPGTFETVRQLKASVREIQAMQDLGDFQGALSRAVALRSRVEATGYKPLLADLLELIGGLSNGWGDPTQAKATLQQALFTALAAHDDATAGRATADLVYVAGRLHEPREAEMWFHLGEAIFDRLGPQTDRTRAWAVNNLAAAFETTGQLERAENLSREAIALKERVLGAEHPDVAITLGLLSDVLIQKGQPVEALAAANRAIDILARNGDPDSDVFADKQYSKGIALIGLGRGAEAEACFSITLDIYQKLFGPSERPMGFPLQGLGEARVVQGAPGTAIPFLERALRIQETKESIRINVAETRFWLARALWESGKDRRRAVTLAAQAKRDLSTHEWPRFEGIVVEWLSAHGDRHR